MMDNANGNNNSTNGGGGAMNDEYGTMNSEGEVYETRSFQLESGKVLRNVTACYRSYGALNAQRDNAMVVCKVPRATQQARASPVLTTMNLRTPLWKHPNERGRPCLDGERRSRHVVGRHIGTRASV